MSRHKKDAPEPETEPEILDQELDEAIGEELGDIVADDLETLYEQIEKLTNERNEAQEQVIRTLADLQNYQRDFQNYRKRNQQEMAQFRLLATEQFVTELLPVLDNFERTIAHVDAGATVESVVAGIKAVEKQLRSALESQNVRRIQSVGRAVQSRSSRGVGHGIEHGASRGYGGDGDRTWLQDGREGYSPGEGQGF